MVFASILIVLHNNYIATPFLKRPYNLETKNAILLSAFEYKMFLVFQFLPRKYRLINV